ncbi:hypothetical protein SAMN05421692_3016 [Chryseobacterium indologenes]|uniref:hypothetical protein n=1 Tax=Chryseobacterium indologenes TaxID=253 RepID=UPI0003E07D00|nr:hypothetical protein [Chryseobacterium indologenes]GAE64980.1 hypothetical protein CIN01S_09_04660 [Chryseobacterium indologenes NBRC 14944]SFJ93652.1 hypothetical protein SAMN05421692_3016 [Chryseobacterium indologenes]SUX50785.1 Uncharacterised protein [Chryseobacterium indologenes]
MKIHIFLITMFCLLSFNISCQTKKIFYTKYEDLPYKKQEMVKTYLDPVKETYPKNDNEIGLMLGYNCFLGQTVTINNKIKKEFQEKNDNQDYGIMMINLEKRNKNIKLKFSDGKKITIKPKEGYDYIFLCYYKNFNQWSIEYYNYPHLHPSE